MLNAVVVELVTSTSPGSMRPNSLCAANDAGRPLVRARADAEAAHLALLGLGLRRDEDLLHDRSERALEPRRRGRKPLRRERLARLAADDRRRVGVARLQAVPRPRGELFARDSRAGADERAQLAVVGLDEMRRLVDHALRREPPAGGQDRAPHDPDRPQIGVRPALVAQPVRQLRLLEQLVEGGAMLARHGVAHRPPFARPPRTSVAGDSAVRARSESHRR